MIETYLILGMIAGTLAGLLGVGGGLIIVPILFEVFTRLEFDSGICMHLAIATSLATIIVTSIMSTLAHHRHRAVLWPVVIKLSPGILFGAALGVAIADLLPTITLQYIFAVFELLVAIQMAWSVRPAAKQPLPGPRGMFLAGGVIGAVSSIIGIGGGTLTVPFLTYCRVTIHQAVASSAACGLPIALSGTVFYIIFGWGDSHLPVNSLGYVYMPAFIWVSASSLLFAPFGAWLAHRLPVVVLRRIFALLLAIIGLRMLFF